jgi:hypothetical protein
VVIRGLDYSTFKLFHLSVLWRASVSSGPDFASVRLGVHEERISGNAPLLRPGASNHVSDPRSSPRFAGMPATRLRRRDAAVKFVR